MTDAGIVWVVWTPTTDYYVTRELAGIFTSKALAEEWVAHHWTGSKEMWEHEGEIEEWRLNSLSPDVGEDSHPS